MNTVLGMRQTESAKDLLYALEVIRHVDILDVLDAAEELARAEGSVILDGRHVQQVLAKMAANGKGGSDASS